MVGDINGDGLADLAISDAANRVYVVYGASGSSANLTLAASAVDASGARGFAITVNDIDNTTANTLQLGTRHRLAPIGDFNGDGLADFIVGNSFGDNYTLSNAGKSYVIYGRTSGASFSLTAMAASDGFRILGESASDYAGWGVDGSGDVNGDGFSDLLVGAPYAFTNGNYGGKTYVSFGGLSGGMNLSAIEFRGNTGNDSLHTSSTTSCLNE